MIFFPLFSKQSIAYLEMSSTKYSIPITSLVDFDLCLFVSLVSLVMFTFFKARRL